MMLESHVRSCPSVPPNTVQRRSLLVDGVVCVASPEAAAVADADRSERA